METLQTVTDVLAYAKMKDTVLLMAHIPAQPVQVMIALMLTKNFSKIIGIASMKVTHGAAMVILIPVLEKNAMMGIGTIMMAVLIHVLLNIVVELMEHVMLLCQAHVIAQVKFIILDTMLKILVQLYVIRVMMG